MRCVLALSLALTSVGCGGRTGPIVDEPERESGVDAAFDDVVAIDSGARDTAVRPDATCVADARPIPPPDCPIVAPRSASACDPKKATTCYYVGCEETLDDDARCLPSGVWSVRYASCASGPKLCPVEQPIDGSACDVIGELCWYDDQCLRRTRAECDPAAMTWSVDRPATCPDASRCPTKTPSVGTKCPACPGSKFDCEYRNGCGLYDTLTCDGDKGTWTAIEEPCSTEAPCPTVQPRIGDACGGLADGTNCAWNNACSRVDHMDCVAGKWRMFHRGKCADNTCPGWRDGMDCTGPDESCIIPLGDGCAYSCTCTYYGSFFGKLHCNTPPCAGDPAVGK